MLGPLILYLKGMRIMMFQLSGFYYNAAPKAMSRVWGLGYRLEWLELFILMLMITNVCDKCRMDGTIVERLGN